MSSELNLSILLDILNEIGREWEYITTNTVNDDVSITLKGFQFNHEVARYTSLTISGTRIQISNCPIAICLCDPKSIELLKNVLGFHEKLSANYSCAACPLMRP